MAQNTEQKTIAGVNRQVRNALEQTGMAPGKLLVVAVSGGPDSLALLHAVHHLRETLDLRLHGAHLDHGLRGDASDADARFVAETFRGLGIEFALEAADVASVRRERRLSLEEAARELRYDFLARVAARCGADAVAVGHTSDDQAETVLMHILRGAGLTGLRGMEPLTRRTISGRSVALVRPLLGVARRETVDYCEALGLEPRTDESNLSTALGRNRVRLELLPLLEQYNPAIRDALVRLSRSAARDLAYMESETDKTWDWTVRVDEKMATIDRAAFSGLNPALQHYVLRRAVQASRGDVEDLEQNHVEDMARLMAGPAGRTLNLPSGMQFAVDYAEATLAPLDAERCPLPPLKGEHGLNVPGETFLPGWRVTAELLEPQAYRKSTEEPADSSTALLFGYDNLGGRLSLRSRAPGDRFQPLGMAQAKKLQDFMVDSRVPRSWRDRVPLVVSPRGIAWVVGWRIADWARVTDDGDAMLKITFESDDR